MALASQHQMDGTSRPLSLVTMYTPPSLSPPDDLKCFRGRAIELGAQYAPGIECEDAIVEITNTLSSEGLYVGEIDEEQVEMIKEQLGEKDMSSERKKCLLIYHLLIWKTAEADTWTLPRTTGECKVTPYLPRLLQVTQMKMEAETVIHGQSLQTEESNLCPNIQKHLTDPENWREVSLPDFINSCMSEEDRLEGSRSQPMVQVVTSKSRKLTWIEGNNNHRESGEELFENVEDVDDEQGEEEMDKNFYVRSNSDMRKLYECRPGKMQGMRLGQFASEYRPLISVHSHGYQSTKDKIDPRTGVGPDAATSVAGAPGVAAPQCMELTNGTLMVRRSEGKAILHLLYSGLPGRHGNELLWSQWKYLEEVDRNKNQIETDLQKTIRLELFPFSVYSETENDEEE